MKSIEDMIAVYTPEEWREIIEKEMEELGLEFSEEKTCICETEDLEKGDTLYVLNSWDGGLDFNYIRPIKYCPVCGKELPEY